MAQFTLVVVYILQKDQNKSTVANTLLNNLLL